MNFKSIFNTQADNQIIIKIIITIVIIIITVIISDVFLVQLGLHQGSMLGPLFVIMLEILLREIKSGCSGKLP